MGVRDLMRWVKTKHPSTIIEIRNRWQDPRLTGKKIALDGTLLTNTFHMGKRDLDAGKEGKGAILGWYRLIDRMRRNNVHPIAVWDQPGARSWKAAEAQKRLGARALALARRNNEDARAERLDRLKMSLTEFEDMSTTDQAAIRAQWQTDAWTRYGPADVAAKRADTPENKEIVAKDSPVGEEPYTVPVSPAAAPSPPATSPADSSSATTSPGVSAWMSQLSSVLASFQVHDIPFKRATRPDPEMGDQLKHVRDLELFSGEEAMGGAVDGESISHEKKRLTQVSSESKAQHEENLIDEKLQEVVGSEGFTETPTQHAMTTEEGIIIDRFLRTPTPPPAPDVGAKAKRGQKRKAAEEDEDEAKGARKTVDPVPEEASVDYLIERIDGLSARVPEVRNIYARALALPTRRDHEDCRELLARLGVPVLIAEVPYEAEGLASALAYAGMVDYVGTEDSDVIAYEAPLLRGLGSEGKPLVSISGSDVRESAKLTPEAFLEFCVLLGTDASPRIAKVGPVSAYNYIKKYGTIDALLEAEPEIRDRIPDIEEYKEMIDAARGVFGYLPPIPENVDLRQGEYDMERVNDWLERKHGWRMDGRSPKGLRDGDEDFEGVEGLQGEEEMSVAEITAMLEGLHVEVAPRPEEVYVPDDWVEAAMVHELESEGEQSLEAR